MGTRAAFWIGNPQDLERREWLGAVAWDGYPDGFDNLDKITTESEFREFVKSLHARDDFSHPERGWPFPWVKDVYLTDYNYMWLDGALKLACFHSGLFTLEEYEKRNESEEDMPDTLPDNVPAPSGYNRNQPDSIMFITAPRRNEP